MAAPFRLKSSAVVSGIADVGFYVEETDGNLRVGQVESGDVLLQAPSGSILNGASAAEFNLQADRVDLIANGSVGSNDRLLGIRGGRLVADSGSGVFVTAFDEVGILQATADNGDIRLAARDTASARDEHLRILASGQRVTDVARAIGQYHRKRRSFRSKSPMISISRRIRGSKVMIPSKSLFRAF